MMRIAKNILRAIFPAGMSATMALTDTYKVPAYNTKVYMEKNDIK